MRCNECGIQNPESFVYCVNCNTQLMKKEKKEKKEEKEENGGYLICEGCNGYYKLQKGERPEFFFNTCECGAKIQYYKSIHDFISENQEHPAKLSNKTSINSRVIGSVVIGIAIMALFLFIVV